MARTEDLNRTISGPHICSHVGSSLISLIDTMLVDAARRAGGSLDDRQISAMLKVIGETPELFALYQSQYNSCAQIHRDRDFANVSPQTVLRLVTIVRCREAIRAAFPAQIVQAGAEFVREVVGLLIARIERDIDPDFAEAVFERYKALARQHGFGVSVNLLLGDAEIAARLDAAFGGLRGPDHVDGLLLQINSLLLERRRAGAPPVPNATAADLERLVDTLLTTKAVIAPAAASAAA